MFLPKVFPSTFLQSSPGARGTAVGSRHFVRFSQNGRTGGGSGAAAAGATGLMEDTESSNRFTTTAGLFQENAIVAMMEKIKNLEELVREKEGLELEPFLTEAGLRSRRTSIDVAGAKIASVITKNEQKPPTNTTVMEPLAISINNDDTMASVDATSTPFTTPVGDEATSTTIDDSKRSTTANTNGNGGDDVESLVDHHNKKES